MPHNAAIDSPFRAPTPLRRGRYVAGETSALSHGAAGKDMKVHLTERVAKAAEPKSSGDRRIFDDDVVGFGLCVYSSNARAFFLRYCIAGRRRYCTIGSWPDWSVSAAREQAKQLKREVDSGSDPLARRIEARHSPTMSGLIDRYLEEHALQLSPRNRSDQTSILRKIVAPEWGTRKVTDITAEDVDRLLVKAAKGRPRPRKHPPRPGTKIIVKATPVRANRVGEVMRKLFNLAIRWQMRTDNPASGFTRNPEIPRDRYLSADEIKRLADVLTTHQNRRWQRCLMCRPFLPTSLPGRAHLRPSPVDCLAAFLRQRK
jgi:hypothetical protein